MRNKILERLNKIKAQANARTLGADSMPWWYAIMIHGGEEFNEFWADVVKNIAGKPSTEIFVTADVFEAMIYGDTSAVPNQFNWDSIPLYTIITCLPFAEKAIMTPRGIAPIGEEYYLL